MKIPKQKLVVAQIDQKLAHFEALSTTQPPQEGWIQTIRESLKMSLCQFGERLKMTPQSAREIEQREAMKTISLNSLSEAAQALDMKLVYGFIPIKGSLRIAVEVRAREVATRIVMRTSQTMKLENQEVSHHRLEKAITELTRELVNDMPRYLWDSN